MAKPKCRLDLENTIMHQKILSGKFVKQVLESSSQTPEEVSAATKMMQVYEILNSISLH